MAYCNDSLDDSEINFIHTLTLNGVFMGLPSWFEGSIYGFQLFCLPGYDQLKQFDFVYKATECINGIGKDPPGLNVVEYLCFLFGKV